MYATYTVKDLIDKLKEIPEDAIIKSPSFGGQWILANPNKITYDEFRGNKICHLEFN